MPLRAHFLRIGLAAFVPLLVFSAALVVLLAREARDTFQRGASERTLAILTAVDTELKRAVAALEALATSRRLTPAEWVGFREEADGVLGSREEWLTIHLALPSGLEVLDLLALPELTLHHVVDKDTFDDVVRHRRPAVGNLIREPITGSHAFPVRVPVLRDEEVVYVLTALVKPDVIAGLLSPQELPADWVGVVLDRDATIVAHTADPAHKVGRTASASLREALTREAHGWFQRETLEGREVFTPYRRSPYSGWTVAMGIPTTAFEASSRRPLTLLAAFGMVSLGASVALAWLLSRRGVASLRDLAEAVEALGAGDSPVTAASRTGSSSIAEVDRLRDAFVEAARLIRARSEERDRVEDSLRTAEAALREADRRKDEFMAMLGHELRNPLGIISTSVQLLRRSEPPDGKPPQLGAVMERQVEHMTRLLDDLLDASRIAAGRIQIEQRPCDFTAIVRDTSEDYRNPLAANGIELELDLPDRPLWITGDPVRLAQIVANLLHNANKFTDAGGKVTVRLAQAHDPDTAVLTVSDTGVGMEAQTLEHLFQVFSQADRTVDRSRGGLGLGLALVKGLTALHGGSVAAHSPGLGQGSAVTVRLPLDMDVTGPQAVALPADDDVAPATVVIVEDNRVAADTLHMFLTAQGHTVEVAHTGPDGITVAERVRPDVVLCDIGLPGVDGYEVARRLRRSEAGSALLIAVTGYGQDADRERGKAAGFDRFLTKPIDLDVLRRMLAEARRTPRRARGGG